MPQAKEKQSSLSLIEMISMLDRIYHKQLQRYKSGQNMKKPQANSKTTLEPPT